jgi:malate dehydrogenase
VFFFLSSTARQFSSVFYFKNALYSSAFQDNFQRKSLHFKKIEELTCKWQQRGYKVTVLGATGGVGQPLSLLLKRDDKFTDLSLFDIVSTHGVATDLSHCNTPPIVRGYAGKEEIGKALVGSDIVIMLSGATLKPGMTRDSLFPNNAGIVHGLAKECALHCPKAMIFVISNPLNSAVPIIAETFKSCGVYDPRKLFGITALDCERASTFVAENRGWDARRTKVSVIGGHAGTTILPLLSQVKHAHFTQKDIVQLTKHIQFGGEEVVDAKAGDGSATLAIAHATYTFTKRVIKAMEGQKDVIENAFVENDLTSCPFFSTPVRFGPHGVEEILPFGPLSEFEQQELEELMPALMTQVQKGIDFVKGK